MSNQRRPFFFFVVVHLWIDPSTAAMLMYIDYQHLYQDFKQWRPVQKMEYTNQLPDTSSYKYNGKLLTYCVMSWSVTGGKFESRLVILWPFTWLSARALLGSVWIHRFACRFHDHHVFYVLGSNPKVFLWGFFLVMWVDISLPLSFVVMPSLRFARSFVYVPPSRSSIFQPSSRPLAETRFPSVLHWTVL